MSKPTREWFADLLEKEIETWEAAARRCEMLAAEDKDPSDWRAKAKRYRRNAEDLRVSLEVLKMDPEGKRP